MTTRYQGHFEHLEFFELKDNNDTHNHTNAHFWTKSLFLLVFAILSDALGNGPATKADEFSKKVTKRGVGHSGT